MTATGISQANPAIVSGATLVPVTGTLILINEITGMAQISGMVFQTTPTGMSEFQLNGLNSSGFATAATAASFQIITPSVWVPPFCWVTAITNAFQSTITTSFDHNYVVGQIVLLSVPKAFGMKEADRQQATILAVPATNQMTVSLNTSTFTPFAFPPASAVPFTFAQVSSIGTAAGTVLSAYDNTGP